MAITDKNTSPLYRETGNSRIRLLEKKIALMEAELDIYREISSLTVKSIDKTVVLSRLMDHLLRALKTRIGTLYLVDQGRGELAAEVVKGHPEGKLKGMRFSLDHGIAGRAARTQKPSMAGNEQSSLLAVPVKVKNEVVGVIEVKNDNKGRPFTKTDLATLATLSNHFTTGMEKVELFTNMNQRIEQFSTLHDVGGLLTSTLNQKVIQERAMEAITRLMNAEAGSLLLIDRRTRELYFEVALGEKGEKIKEMRLKIGEGIAGWVAKFGRPALVPDVTKDRRFQSRVDKKIEFSTKNMICVPVRIKDRTIGVLQAINKVGGEFTREDLKLFELFSNQVAVALDNARLYEEIKQTFYATSEALADAIDKRDPYTGGHTKRVLGYSLAIAKEMDLPAETVELVKISSVLHDIGKIGIDDSILRKNATLDEKETTAMKRHPAIGAEILKHVPQLKDIVPGIFLHHERVDGKGYPRGLKNKDIPVVARIISVADTYDAMTTTRPYRKGMSRKKALDELKRLSGKQFDSTVVNAFSRSFVNEERAGQGRMKRPGPPKVK